MPWLLHFLHSGVLTPGIDRRASITVQKIYDTRETNFTEIERMIKDLPLYDYGDILSFFSKNSVENKCTFRSLLYPKT